MIECSHLTKRYTDGSTAVDDVSLKVDRGEFVVVIGPQGCGKTTTLRMINRLVEPTSGTVLVEGQDDRNFNPVQLRRNFGYVIQQIGLMPHLTISENISFVLRLQGVKKAKRRERAEELMHLAGMDPAQFKRPSVGHFILASWEKKGLLECVITQNVDGMHQMAGTRQVYELHGSLATARCNHCNMPTDSSDFLARATCSQCGGKLRPNVVLFGELLPEDAWECSMLAMESAELVVVIGTSLQVYPVNQLPLLAGGKMAVIHSESTTHDEVASLVIRDFSTQALERVDELLHARLEGYSS